ncbi:hypothetical protein [Agromyces humi]|uniref:hypothetical protein n=1 Tax=Agromyces humi TaxID=1766800 RepID=UPI00135705AA|nr:hypothetical protein [Agromyces humi]
MATGIENIPVGGHTIPLGTPVTVTKQGVLQPWEGVTVFRHDRNRTYRLHFPNDTYVTAHENELTVIAPEPA